MKKLAVLFCAFLLLNTAVSAQRVVEVKLNPIGLLWGFIAPSAEFELRNDFSIETGVAVGGGNLIEGVFVGGVGGRYYFNPKHPMGGFGIGMDLLAGNFEGEGAVALLFSLRRKWVGKGPISFEVAAGTGRATKIEIFGYGRVTVGYRFTGKNKSKQEKK